MDSGTNKWLVLIATVFGVFMSALDGTITTVALPKLQTIFGADVHQIQWVVTGYTLALGVSIPISGWAADRFGIKRAYIASLAAFTAGSALCGLAFNTPSLIAFRVLQGLGGGPLLPLSLAILFATFPPEERGLANGAFGVPVLFAPALGPTLGGFIVQHLNWQLIFLLNVPIGIVGTVLALRWLRESAPRPGASFDLRGFSLISAGSVLLLYALGNGAYDGWGAPQIRASLASGIVLLLIFVAAELRSRAPLMDLRLFRNVGFSVATVIIWLNFVGLYAATFLLPLFLQNLRGQQPFDTGVLLLWQALATLVVTPFAGLGLNRFGPRPFLVVGMSILVVTSWQLAWLSTTTSSFSAFIPPLLLRGAGLGLTIATSFTAALGIVAPPELPRASALINVTNQIVISLAVAVLVTVLQQNTPAHSARLAEAVNVNNPAAVQSLTFLTGLHESQGMSPVAANARAVAEIYGQTQLLANAESFRDALLLTALLAAPGALLAFAVRRPPDTLEGLTMAA